MSCFQCLSLSAWLLLVIVNAEFCLSAETWEQFDQNSVCHFLLLAISVYGLLLNIGILLFVSRLWILMNLIAAAGYLIATWHLFILITKSGNFHQL